MTNDEYLEQSADDDGAEERIELTPEQTENLCRAMASVQQPPISKIGLPTFALAETALKHFGGIAETLEAQRKMVADVFKPMLDAQTAWRKQLSEVIATDRLQAVRAGPVRPRPGRRAGHPQH